MSALVSIVIPVYNLEKYIENCIKSIQKQIYENLEIICVDDGSTDNSSKVIKCLADKDSRIRYIYQSNAGVSAARIKGLSAVKGEYGMFVDGDDYMHYQAVEIFLNCIENSDFDVICASKIKTFKTDEKCKKLQILLVRRLSTTDCFHTSTIRF